MIFWRLVVPRLRCALIQSAFLLARKRFAKNGAGSDAIGIPVTMIFPTEKKQLCKKDSIASVSNNFVKTKWCSVFLDDHDAQLCLLIVIESLVPPLNTKSTTLYKISQVYHGVSLYIAQKNWMYLFVFHFFFCWFYL